MPAADPTVPTATSRLAHGLACAGLAQLVQMPYLRETGEAVSPAFFAAHGLLVVAVHVSLALGLGRWRGLWTGVVFAAAPALAVWPTIHLFFGATGLQLLGVGVLLAVTVLAWLAPRPSPLVAAAAGGVLGAELARWCQEGADLTGVARPLVAGALGIALLGASRWRPRLAPMPGPLASFGLACAAMALAALVAPVAPRPFPAGPEGPVVADAPAPVVLIVLDTLRADHLAMYGYARETMPTLERFARERGVVVDRAVSVGSTSLPTHASMFTGLDPPRHGARYAAASDPDPPRFAHPLGPGPPTLAELLGQAGYWSVGTSGNAGPLAPEYGLARGFDVYDASFDSDAEHRGRTAWHMASRRAEPLVAFANLPVFREVEFFEWGQRYRRAGAIADQAIDAVDAAGDRPFFLFVNFIDPHWPYNPPTRCREVFGRPDQAWDRNSQSPQKRVNLRDGVLEPREREQIVALYDGELRCMDQALARVLARLEEHPRWDDMLVVITSDHGDAFGEHDLMAHGVSLYDEQVRVPLVIKPGRGAGLPRPGTHLPGPMQSTDLFATALEHAAIALPLDGDGTSWGRGRQTARSWLGVRRRLADKRPDRFRRDLRSFEEDGWKLVVSSRGRRELYDLARDPGENVDRSTSEADRLARLEAQLGPARSSAPALRADPGEQTLDRLRALGYVD